MRNITMADIAKETGYSINTISHALNDKPDIAPKTKKYIIETAEKMGYIANASAGALRSGKSKSVAIIVGDISNPHFAIMIKEMEGCLREYGYNAIIMNTDEDEDIEHIAIVSAVSKNVDGIIICPVQKTRRNIEFMEKMNIPYVFFGRRFDDVRSNYVICDDINGGFTAAEHLLKNNHKDILFINAPLYISSASERLEGIKKAFEMYATKDCRLTTVEISVHGDGESVLTILKKNSGCNGIICFSDLVAMHVCYFLRQQNRKIPDDVSIVGFDNIGSKFYFPLMLTSVTSSKTKMSVKAVEILMENIEGKENGICQCVLPTKLVERESTKYIL